MLGKISVLMAIFALAPHLAFGDDASKTDKDRLQAAVEAGQLDAVVALLKKGVDPNAYTDISLLSIAIGNGNPEMLKLLLKAGTKVEVPVPGPPPPLDVAMMASDGRVFDVMMATHPTPSHDQSEDLYYDLYGGLGANFGAVQVLDPKIEPKAKAGLAEWERRLGVLKRAGFDINAADDKTGETVLILAVKDHAALPVLQKMVAAGANPLLRNKDGKSSADLAAAEKEIDVLRFLDVDHAHAALLHEHDIPAGSLFVGSWSRSDDMGVLELSADGSGLYAGMAGYNVAWKQAGGVATLELAPSKGNLPDGTTLTATAHITADGKKLKLDLVQTGSPPWTEELSRTQQ